ncbi:MAG: hypothetical protein ABSF84_17275, partial [Acidimicrobiales bacterium]
MTVRVGGAADGGDRSPAIAQSVDTGWWVDHLSGCPDLSTFPLPRARPAVLGSGRARTTCSSAVVGDGWSEGSPDLGLLTVVAALLVRYSPSDEVVLGLQRPGDGLLPLRLPVDTRSSVGALRVLVEAAVAEGAIHGTPDLASVGAALGLTEDPSRAPVVQVAVSDARSAPPVGTPLDITWELGSDGARATVTIDFSTDLFDEATVARMAAQFGRLMDQALADPDRPIDELDLLD